MAASSADVSPSCGVASAPVTITESAENDNIIGFALLAAFGTVQATAGCPDLTPAPVAGPHPAVPDVRPIAPNIEKPKSEPLPASGKC